MASEIKKGLKTVRVEARASMEAVFKKNNNNNNNPHLAFYLSTLVDFTSNRKMLHKYAHAFHHFIEQFCNISYINSTPSFFPVFCHS